MLIHLFFPFICVASPKKVLPNSLNAVFYTKYQGSFSVARQCGIVLMQIQLLPKLTDITLSGTW